MTQIFFLDPTFYGPFLACLFKHNSFWLSQEAAHQAELFSNKIQMGDQLQKETNKISLLTYFFDEYGLYQKFVHKERMDYNSPNSLIL